DITESSNRPLFPQWSHHVYPQFLPGSHPNHQPTVVHGSSNTITSSSSQTISSSSGSSSAGGCGNLLNNNNTNLINNNNPAGMNHKDVAGNVVIGGASVNGGTMPMYYGHAAAGVGVTNATTTTNTINNNNQGFGTQSMQDGDYEVIVVDENNSSVIADNDSHSSGPLSIKVVTSASNSRRTSTAKQLDQPAPVGTASTSDLRLQACYQQPMLSSGLTTTTATVTPTTTATIAVNERPDVVHREVPQGQAKSVDSDGGSLNLNSTENDPQEVETSSEIMPDDNKPTNSNDESWTDVNLNDDGASELKPPQRTDGTTVGVGGIAGNNGSGVADRLGPMASTLGGRMDGVSGAGVDLGAGGT
uniref:Uncharacterized protein n=1 Tax=Anopheles maculatus TaxID=74869 RepID=A0A182SCP0_9DIPT